MDVKLMCLHYFALLR